MARDRRKPEPRRRDKVRRRKRLTPRVPVPQEFVWLNFAVEFDGDTYILHVWSGDSDTQSYNLGVLELAMRQFALWGATDASIKDIGYRALDLACEFKVAEGDRESGRVWALKSENPIPDVFAIDAESNYAYL